MKKVMIELAFESYDHLRTRCDPSSPELELLINACIDTRLNGKRIERIVQILCEKEQAVRLLSIAIRVCPDAVPAIRRSLGLPADQ
jgi:hypothetical protein